MEKRKYYSKYDSGMAFCWAIFTPQIFAIIFVSALMIVASMIGQTYESLIENLVVNAISILISPLAFLTVFYLVNKRKKVDWKSATGFSFKLNWINVIVCIIISFICVFGVNDFVTLFDVLISLTGFKGVYALPLPLTNGWWLVLNLVLLAVLPAIMEELVFRGIIFNGLKQYGKNIAVFGSALLFALMHGGIEQTIYPIIVGVILGLVMLKTNNIVYPIIIHFFNNAIVVVYNFIYTLLNGNAMQVYEITTMGVISAIVYFIASICVVYALIKFVIKKQKKVTLNTFEGIDKISIEHNTQSNFPNKLLWFGTISGIIFWIIDLISGFGA